MSQLVFKTDRLAQVFDLKHFIFYLGAALPADLAKFNRPSHFFVAIEDKVMDDLMKPNRD